MKVLENQSGKFDFSHISQECAEEHGSVAYRPDPIAPYSNPATVQDAVMIVSPAQEESIAATGAPAIEPEKPSAKATATKGATK